MSFISTSSSAMALRVPTPRHFEPSGLSSLSRQRKFHQVKNPAPAGSDSRTTCRALVSGIRFIYVNRGRSCVVCFSGKKDSVVHDDEELDTELAEKCNLSLLKAENEEDRMNYTSFEVTGNEGDQYERTWFQEQYVSLVLPIVRVLNGSEINKLQDSVDSGETNEQKPNEVSWSLLKALNGTLPAGYHRRQISRRLRQAEADFFIFTSHLGKFLLTMMATGAILATGYELAGGNSQLETVLWCSWLAGIIVGSMIGAEKVLEKRFRAGPRNVVITGSTRGLGKALAREFLLAGDRVVIASRSSDSVSQTVKELEEELSSRMYHLFPMESRNWKHDPKVVGIACDVSSVDDVKALADFAVDKLGSIDIWINNAGVNKGFRPLIQFSDDDINQIVSANMIGSLLCSREAMRVMRNQPKGGHIFNMDGAGSGGSSTPLTAVYGATKCGLRQLHTSLLKECKRSRIGIHTASPGMVLTDLLLSGASLQNKQMFNIICELPETVARTLVPRMREIKGTGKAVNYLTPPRILLALITAWLRRGRWFDEEGRAVYEAEADRLRNWAEDRTRLPFSAAMDQFSDATMVSVFSITVVCAFIMLSSVDSGMPGT